MLYGDPEQMGNWSSRNRVEAFRSRSPIEMSRGGTPQAISTERSLYRRSRLATGRSRSGEFQCKCLTIRQTENGIRLQIARQRGPEISKRPGTHRGHNKVFLAARRTPSSASAFLWFIRVTFSYPAFTPMPQTLRIS